MDYDLKNNVSLPNNKNLRQNVGRDLWNCTEHRSEEKVSNKMHIRYPLFSLTSTLKHNEKK